jgi:hypothetical protein
LVGRFPRHWPMPWPTEFSYPPSLEVPYENVDGPVAPVSELYWELDNALI